MASYDGNLGLMELVKFFRNAPPELVQRVQRLIDAGAEREVWQIVQQYTGTELQGDEFRAAVAESVNKYGVSDKEQAAAKKRVAAMVAKRKATDKRRKHNIRSGHNKLLKQFMYDEGMKVIQQWQEQLQNKFPKFPKSRGPVVREYGLSPIGLVKSVMRDGVEHTAKKYGELEINPNGLDEKPRHFVWYTVIPASQEILRSLLGQIDVDTVKAAYDDPSILEGNKAQKGIPANATDAELKAARKAGGEKGQRAHWLLNMRKGNRNKKK